MALRPLRASLNSSARSTLRLKRVVGEPSLEDLRRETTALLDELRSTRLVALGVLACPAGDPATDAAKTSNPRGFRRPAPPSRRRLRSVRCARAQQAGPGRPVRAGPRRLPGRRVDGPAGPWRSHLQHRPWHPGWPCTLCPDHFPGHGLLRFLRSHSPSLRPCGISRTRLRAGAGQDLDAVVRMIRPPGGPRLPRGGWRPPTGAPTNAVNLTPGSPISLVDTEMRGLNKAVLASDLDTRRLGTPAQWEDITRLRGPRVRRLREIIGTLDRISA